MMSMVHEGDTQYEDGGPAAEVITVIKAVIKKHGNTVLRIGRWALVVDQVFASAKTIKPPKPKKLPPPRDGASTEPEAEAEQVAENLKPPHLAVLKWIKPPPSVQVHLKNAKVGTGLAHFLEVRVDLWAMMSTADREAAVMTKLLEREVADDEDGAVKVKKAALPIQTHPAVERIYGRWWERMDPATRTELAAED